MSRLSDVPPIDAQGRIWAVIESPRGSRHKLTYRPDLDAFELSAGLPVGMQFPFDFGFFPGTRAADGDPLDALVLLDGPTYPGTLVQVRLLGVLDARQREGRGRPYRNDRIIAIAVESTEHGELSEVRDMDPDLLDQIESYFETYAQLRGKSLAVLARRGRRAARRRLDASIRAQAGMAP